MKSERFCKLGNCATVLYRDYEGQGLLSKNYHHKTAYIVYTSWQYWFGVAKIKNVLRIQIDMDF